MGHIFYMENLTAFASIALVAGLEPAIGRCRESVTIHVLAILITFSIQSHQSCVSFHTVIQHASLLVTCGNFRNIYFIIWIIYQLSG